MDVYERDGLWSAVCKRVHVQTQSLTDPDEPGPPKFLPGLGPARGHPLLQLHR